MYGEQKFTEVNNINICYSRCSSRALFWSGQGLYQNSFQSSQMAGSSIFDMIGSACLFVGFVNA